MRTNNYSGEMPKGDSPISRANLVEPWTSETAPKSRGRRNAGLSLIEWCNEMHEWPTDKIKAVRDDENAPHFKRRAAAKLLSKRDTWHVVEHTHRRPRTESDVTHHNDEPRTEPERAAARDSALARIRGRIQRTA